MSETSKPMELWTFKELQARCLEMELDAIVTGMPLSKRIYQTVDLATRWSQAAGKG